MELVKGVGKIQGSKIHEVSPPPARCSGALCASACTVATACSVVLACMGIWLNREKAPLQAQVVAGACQWRLAHDKDI